MLSWVGSRVGGRWAVASGVRWSASTSSAAPAEPTAPAIPSPRRTGVQASFKKGTGGRASFSGNVCTIFGAPGFLGEYIVSRLAKDGTQIIIPYRTDPCWVRNLKVAGDLGQILFFPFDLRDEDSIRKVVKYSNVVINLIGRDHETPNYSFYDVNEHGARRVARICREMRVERLIHFSALNASLQPVPKLIPGGSQFLRSKAKGELAVREEFPTATIVRPADMYGEYDRFITPFMSRWRKGFHNRIELYAAGEDSYKMPVFAVDVCSGVQKIVNDPMLDGQTFEFVGPHCHNLANLVDFMYNLTGFYYKTRRYHRGHGYSFLFHVKTNYIEWRTLVTKSRPMWNWEFLERVEATSDVLTGCPTLTDIGVKNLAEFKFAAHPLIEQLGHQAWFFPKRGQWPTCPLVCHPPLTTVAEKKTVRPRDKLERMLEFA